MVKIIKGNLLELAKNSKFDIIAHGCNCFCVMGAGIARAIAVEFPENEKIDSRTVRGDKNKLGTYEYVIYPEFNDLVVVNAYTQYSTANIDNMIPFDYDAFETILKNMKEEFTGLKFGVPWIGCGLAGGDKDKVLDIINNIMDDEDVTIVEL